MPHTRAYELSLDRFAASCAGADPIYSMKAFDTTIHAATARLLDSYDAFWASVVAGFPRSVARRCRIGMFPYTGTEKADDAIRLRAGRSVLLYVQLRTELAKDYPPHYEEFLRKRKAQVRKDRMKQRERITVRQWLRAGIGEAVEQTQNYAEALLRLAELEEWQDVAELRG